jgi:hypothetical protein
MESQLDWETPHFVTFEQTSEQVTVGAGALATFPPPPLPPPLPPPEEPGFVPVGLALLLHAARSAPKHPMTNADRITII